jgi:hypothetical protein
MRTQIKKNSLVFLSFLCYFNANAQDFKNLDFNEVTNGKLDHWTLEGDGTYDLITVDTLFDTVTLYDGGNTFVKLYTDDTSKIQSAKLVQRAKYEGKYIKDIRIKELFMSNDTTRSRLAGLYIKMYYWDTALNSRRYIYTSGYPFTDSRAPRYPDTIGLFSYNGGLEFPAPDFTTRVDSIEINFDIFDFTNPQFKQTLYFDDLQLIYATASVDIPDKLESKLYPNPAENIAKLEFTNNELKRVYVTDLSGRIVLEITTSKSSLDLDISSWFEGLYTIRCVSENKTSIHKLIKQ